MGSSVYSGISLIYFNGLHGRWIFFEYDSDRAGVFEPLRFVLDDQIIVLGLISSNVPELETKSENMKRLEEASQ